MPSKEPLTLEQNLALSNAVLKSNPSRLASLMRAYEQCEWTDAFKRASVLIHDKPATDAYIEAVRQDPTREKFMKQQAKPRKSKDAAKDAYLPLFESNFALLEKLAPDLDEELTAENAKSMVGKSQKTGYAPLFLKLTDSDKTGFYVTLLQEKEVDGESVPNPKMELLINLTNKTVEALSFEDQTTDKDVYPDKVERNMTDMKELKEQNEYLRTWLTKLLKQGHEMTWIDAAKAKPKRRGAKKTEEPESVIIDLYGKDNQQPEPAQKPKGKTSEEPEPKSEPKIIPLASAAPLSSDYNTRFMRIVDFTDFGMRSEPNAVGDRVQNIRDGVGIPVYLIESWDKLEKESHRILKMFNYLMLSVFAKWVVDLRDHPNAQLRLVSDTNKVAYAVQLANAPDGKPFTVAIYQLDPSKEEVTLLLKIDQEERSLSVDLVMNGFGGFPPFNNDQKEATNELLSHIASMSFVTWMESLMLDGYKIIQSNLTTEGEAGTVPVKQHYSKHYINADIPHFERGHVQLTPTHIKHGITQEIIDTINKTKKGVILVPYKKLMKPTTKSIKADRKKQALQSGFRLSAEGLFYDENRSNHADRSLTGGL